MIARINTTLISDEEWKCDTHFILSEGNITELAWSVLASHADHKGWAKEDTYAWVKSSSECKYLSETEVPQPSGAACSVVWNAASLCGQQIELEHMTEAVFNGNPDSFFIWTEPETFVGKC